MKLILLEALVEMLVSEGRLRISTPGISARRVAGFLNLLSTEALQDWLASRFRASTISFNRRLEEAH